MPKKNLDEIHKKGYLTKDEVLDSLDDRYFIDLTPRTLKYYGTIGLIDPGIKENVKGIVGSVSLYSQKTVEIIYLIKFLQIEGRLTLDRMSEYLKILNLDDDSFNSFIKVVTEYNKLLSQENELFEKPKNKKFLEKNAMQEYVKIVKYASNYWEYREKISKSKEYIDNFKFTAIVKALIEISSAERIDRVFGKYVSDGNIKIGKDRIIVIFKKLIKKEVIFLKNKIEIKTL